MGLSFARTVGPRSVSALVLLTIAIPPCPSDLAGQESGWTAVSVQMDVVLASEDGSAEVTMRYTLGATAGDDLPVTRPLGFELLGFGDATVERFRTPDGDSVELWPTHGSHSAASVFVSRPWLTSTAGVLELSYRVEAAVIEEDGHLRARIPVLTGPPGTTGEDGGFTARLVLPPGWTPSESFPSGLRDDGAGAWTVSLQTSPSMVGFRGRSDGTWRPGLPLAVDLVTLLILVGFSVIGWRHLSGVARRARA